MKLTKEAWLGGLTVSERDERLLALAYDILEGNAISGEDCPWGNKPAVSPWVGKGRTEGIWNWDTAFHVMALSRFDTDLAKSSLEVFCSTQLENGMFPDVWKRDGGLVDYLSKPPVLPWATLILYRADGDKDFLRERYEQFIKNEAFWVNERSSGGLFYYSSQKDIEKDFYICARWESGWDNSPRWDTPIIDLWAIDLNCFMVQFYRSMAEMAKILGEKDVWSQKAERLAGLIEERMFNEQKGYYADTNRHTGEQIDTLSPASFMPLYIGIASKERAEKMHELAKDKSKFYPGMPTVTYDHPQYSQDYWRGPTWLNVAFFAVKGLYDYGFDKTAGEIKQYLLDMIDRNSDDGIFENYDSVAQKGLYWHRFSWSAAFVIEFILGL